MSEKTACAYVRVSTERQEELSPESQIREIREYAVNHHLKLLKIYREEHGISGKNADKRPAFQEMIAACRDTRRRYDVILVWKFSRFARNIDESTYYKSMLRKKCGVEIISISEPVMEGMYGRLIELIIEWSDEFYLYNLSGEVMRGMTQNALRGGYNSIMPLGYTREKGKNSVPCIEPKGASIVRNIFDWYVNEKMSMRAIARRLNENGCKTRRGRDFDAHTIGYILDNPFYTGQIRWNYYDRARHKKKPKEEVILCPGRHEPIISDDLFEAARKARGRKARLKSACACSAKGELYCDEKRD